ncbi:putative ferric reductase transmembrane component 7 protein [Botrytis fragariae]|uniref:ferric-chelate reductase (NADPH) n=1 Tax=Botrytis fragariae TaxID=1964551 RepID=A0A8H6ASV3_9HELO|nr:putative ferric reductase transmembrane component 7 protein [Botrytis fragariae]KAF5873007.1 putative ferric reductase transmembrane component 7 protein [Botrytis fragariae]
MVDLTSKGVSAVEAASQAVQSLAKRIYIPFTAASPPGLIAANTLDPWNKAGKYALAWTYFPVIIVCLVAITRAYHLWTDKLRQAYHKNEVEKQLVRYYQQQQDEYTMTNIHTGESEQQFFPATTLDEKPYIVVTKGSHWSSIPLINDTLALFRWVFYRPIPELRYKKKLITAFPSLAVVALLIIGLIFVTLQCFLPQPLYWERIGHDRLGVFHRWGGYLCLFLALVHTIPFYIQPVWDDGGMTVFGKLFPASRGIIYGTGIACLVPLGWLVIGSLPIVRRLAYELFVVLHIPAAIVYVAMLFWHTNNYLTSWNYLYATVAIWALAYLTRIGNLNWAKPWRNSFLIGDEAAITLMAENAIKVTVPTQMTWRPGQYVYLRMPGISVFENHPFTISSLCSEDFPSEYGEQYRDCTMVFRPFGGFTKKVLETATHNGPFKTYRAYLDGPYGGMQRELAAFDTVILFAGGSGITAIVSQLLNLIKRMRDGKAVTQKIEVVWALKRLESMDWFREELRICREYAPPDTINCQFFVTTAKRYSKVDVAGRAQRPLSTAFHDKLDGFVAGIASKRNSALIRDEAQGNEERERELRMEDEDAITSLPHSKHLQPRVHPNVQTSFLPPPTTESKSKNSEKRRSLLAALSPDSHEATRKFLSPLGFATKPQSDSKESFHFPVPPQKLDAPHFQYAPPSANPNRDSFVPDTARNSYNPQDHIDDPAEAYNPDMQSSEEGQLSDQFAPREFAPTPPAKDIPKMSSEIETTPSLKPPQPAHLRQKSEELKLQIPQSNFQHSIPDPTFDFGFPSTPTLFQKNLMRFAFVAPKKKEGWTTEYGRPDLGYMLKEMATGGPDGHGIFGRRTCVFVCGPPEMRINVATTVAKLQADIWGDDSKDEIFLHTENYAI